jgi:hypothetical protein
VCCVWAAARVSCSALFSRLYSRCLLSQGPPPSNRSLTRFRYKPAIAAGRWGFDGGAAKSDCVEMAIREIVDLVLWDESRGAFNLELLPRSAVAGLRDMCAL